MTLGQYALYSLLGLCVVFAALALLMLIIKLFGLIPGLADNPKKDGSVASTAKEGAAVAVAEPVSVCAPGSAGELKLFDTDPRDAAMVMAIVADELGKPLNELRFISIKEVRK